MKKSKLIIITLIAVLLLQAVLPVTASAASITAASAFEYRVTKAEAASAPGNIQVELYCKTDPQAKITTFGATLVIDTDYVDLISKKGEVLTDSYKQEVLQLGKTIPLTASKIGSDEETFSSVKGLSLASYNASSKDMYLFLCGMSIGGISMSGNTQVVTMYLNTKKDGVLPAGSIRLMNESEYGTACPSKAVFVNTISTTTDLGDGVSKMSLDVDASLMEEAPVTTEPSTEATTQEQPTSAQEPESTEQPTEAETEEMTTKPVEEMTEPEIEKEIEQKISIHDDIVIPEEKQQIAAVKAYNAAVEKAKKVLEDKDATKEEKAEALEELREAEQALKEEIPEVATQIEAAEKELQNASKRTKWVFIAAGSAAVVAAGIIIVLIIRKKKKTN